MFQPFSDDHKNFIFKDRGVKFIVLDHIIMKIHKKESDKTLFLKLLQNLSPKL